MRESSRTSRPAGSEDHLRELARKLKLAPAAQAYLGNASTGPSRVVGRGGGTAIRGRIPFERSSRTLQSESVTCEELYVLRCAIDDRVELLLDQPPAVRAVRTTRSGRRHISTYTPDFLEVTESVALVECKPLVQALQLCREKPGDWQQLGPMEFRFIPVQEECGRLGFEHKVVTDHPRAALELANLEVLFDRKMTPDDGSAEQWPRLSAVLGRRPCSLAELLDSRSGISLATVLSALANGVVYTPLHVAAVNDKQKAIYFTSRQDAERRGMVPDLSAEDPIVRDTPLALATSAELELAIRLWEQFQEPLLGKRSYTRNEYRYKTRLEEVVAKGEKPLTAFLTSISKRGNRNRRIADQLPYIDQGIKEHILCPHPKSIADATACINKNLSEKDVPTVSAETVRLELLRHEPGRVARMQGGTRAANKLRRSADPRMRQLIRGLTAGLKAHIDSSPEDNRQWLQVGAVLKLVRPVFSIAVCARTTYPLGLAVGLGTPGANLTALLLRDVIRRQGFLPRWLLHDRGPEFVNTWLRQTQATYLCAIRERPTATPEFGSTAENAVKHVNYQCLRQLEGSTRNDEAERSADGKLKSRATAVHSFKYMTKLLQEYVFEISPTRPYGDGSMSIQDAFRAELNELPTGATMSLERLEDRVATSVPLKKIPQANGFRFAHNYRRYSSDRLIDELRRGEMEEVRPDPETPEVVYVRCRGAWFETFSHDYQELQLLDPVEKLVATMVEPELQAQFRDQTRAFKGRKATFFAQKKNELAGTEGPETVTREVEDFWSEDASLVPDLQGKENAGP